MTRPELTGQQAADEADAFSVAQFCKRHGISVTMFYKLRQQGQAPDLLHVGDRVLVTRESAARWRKNRTRKATAPAT
jgi:hypothetical protein